MSAPNSNQRWVSVYYSQATAYSKKCMITFLITLNEYLCGSKLCMMPAFNGLPEETYYKNEIETVLILFCDVIFTVNKKLIECMHVLRLT